MTTPVMHLRLNRDETHCGRHIEALAHVSYPEDVPRTHRLCRLCQSMRRGRVARGWLPEEVRP